MLPLDAFTTVPSAENGETTEKPFLQCTFNAGDKGGFRSPWTNRYYLTKTTNAGVDVEIYEKTVSPQEQDVRDIEGAANEVWEAYTHLYYGPEAVGSVFLKPRDKGPFEGFFGVHKRTTDNGKWDTVHLVQVDEPNEEEATCCYRVDSAVVMCLSPYENSTVSSSLTKETVKTCKVHFSINGVNGSHLENIGKIIEQVEIDFRSRMERVDIPKSMEVIESIYRKTMVGSTVHLIKERVSMASGNAGAGMIRAIADLAKHKRGRNPFMLAMQKNQKERQAKETRKLSTQDQTTDNLSAFKSNLRKTAPKPNLHMDSTPTPEFMNFRNKLKKTGN
jgi:hypothetical protein